MLLTVRQATTIAQDKWVRIAANMHLGAYEVVEATAPIPTPTWPSKKSKTG